MFFAFLPPEVNSGLMYAGPGSGPLTATAAAWDDLANDLYATASSYESVLSNLNGAWSGPSATTMASAATPFVAWMSSTAAQAAQAGAQVKAAVAAYETAFAMTVPPEAVAANRILLANLIATNIFGQNTPAIAATEADYLEMWAQDVAAMNGYAASSSGATQVTAFNAPPVTTNAAATATPSVSASDAASALAGLTNLGAEAQSALSSLTTSGPLSGVLSGVLGGLDSAQGTQGASVLAQFAMYPAQMLIQMSTSLNQAGGSGLVSSGSEELLTSIGNFVDSKMQLVVGGISDQLRTFGSSVSAQLAHASQIGGMSIPPGWSNAAHGGGLTRAAGVVPMNSISSPTLAQAESMTPSPLARGLLGAVHGDGPPSITGKMPPAKVFVRSPAGG